MGTMLSYKFFLRTSVFNLAFIETFCRSHETRSINKEAERFPGKHYALYTQAASAIYAYRNHICA